MTSYSWKTNHVGTFKKYPWVQIQTLLRCEVHDSCPFAQKWTYKMANHFLQGNPNDQNAHLFWQIPFLCVPHQISLIKLQINFKVSFLATPISVFSFSQYFPSVSCLVLTQNFSQMQNLKGPCAPSWWHIMHPMRYHVRIILQPPSRWKVEKSPWNGQLLKLSEMGPTQPSHCPIWIGLKFNISLEVVLGVPVWNWSGWNGCGPYKRCLIWQRLVMLPRNASPWPSWERWASRIRTTSKLWRIWPSVLPRGSRLCLQTPGLSPRSTTSLAWCRLTVPCMLVLRGKIFPGSNWTFLW